jgi:ATP-binding cassette subfamily B protein
MNYAGNYKYFTYASWVLSAVSALIALVPFWYIWRIIKEVLEVYPDFSKAQNLPHYGWMAVLFAVLSMLIPIHLEIAAGVCREFWKRKIAENYQ